MSDEQFYKIAQRCGADKILIYSTNPQKNSGIDKAFFDKYYIDREQAVAYKLRNVVKYEEPRKLKDYGISSAPQSFQYIEEM